jgi:ABC transporter substrate binding protein
MRRRDFIAGIAGSAAAWPVGARAQQHRGPVRVAFIPIGSPSNPYDRSLVEAFQRGLRRVGLTGNQDIALDIVWAGDRPDQAVSEALQRGAELLIPCGSSDILAELSGKLVDVARELIKPHTVIHYLWHTAWPDGQNRYQATEQAVRTAGMQLESKGIAEMSELDAAVAAIKMSGSPAFIVQPSPFTYRLRGPIIASAQKNGLGTIFAFPAAAREGALVAYGPDYVHMYSRAAFYVDRVLKGAKPTDLPVEGPSKVELLVNLQAAKALGIEVPLSLLVRADELFE